MNLVLRVWVDGEEPSVQTSNKLVGSPQVIAEFLRAVADELAPYADVQTGDAVEVLQQVIEKYGTGANPVYANNVTAYVKDLAKEKGIKL